VAWSIDDKTVLRASTGLMYDQPILGGYEQALQLSGSPKAPAYTFSPAAAGAPLFPSPCLGGGHARRAVALGGRSELRRRAHVPDQHPGRAVARRDYTASAASSTPTATTCRS
jgi:hypothetical protein